MSARLLGPLTLRPRGGRWWALNRRDRGFASFGYPFDFLGEALDAFEARVETFGFDEHGLWIQAITREVAS